LVEQAFARFAAARRVWEQASAHGFHLLSVPDIWTADVSARLKSQIAGEAFPKLTPQPIVREPAGERPRLPHEVIGHGASTYAPAPPVRPPVRALRRDGAPKDGERQIVFLRGGAELGDGFTSLAGDVVNVGAGQAAELIRSGAADYVTVAGG
jgi:hypothetical protein